MIDLETDAATPASKGDVARISKLAEEILDLRVQIESTSNKLKAQQKLLLQLEESTLPELMDELRIAEVTLPNRVKVSIKSIIRASLPTTTGIQRAKGEQQQQLRERLRAGLQWLREHGADSIIKNTISTDIGKGEDAQAAQLEQLMVEQGFMPERSEGVHPQTLSAYVRERINAGDDVPFDTFGVFSGRKANITTP